MRALVSSCKFVHHTVFSHTEKNIRELEMNQIFKVLNYVPSLSRKLGMVSGVKDRNDESFVIISL